MNETRYSVFPRYSGGSPAVVDRDTAHRVAHEEKQLYEEALQGHDGPKEQKRAELLGLDGIVQVLTEMRSDHFEVYDLITEKTWVRPTTWKIFECGYLTWDVLPEDAKKVVNVTGRERDYTHGFYLYYPPLIVEEAIVQPLQVKRFAMRQRYASV